MSKAKLKKTINAIRKLLETITKPFMENNL